MKVVSWNVNGLRAVEKKGELRAMIRAHDPDIILLQETKISSDQTAPLEESYPAYSQEYQCAQKKGYSGVAIWLRKGLEYRIERSMPGYTDDEGRIIHAIVEGMRIVSVYFPNGGKSPQAWEDKLVFYDRFLAFVDSLDEPVIFAGDVNCAHHEIDIARPKENEGKIGFHPRERAWMDTLVSHGWIDIFRFTHPDAVVYSWWHLISRARERDVGWRIDYVFTKDASRIGSVSYDTAQMGSDHCPVVFESG